MLQSAGLTATPHRLMVIEILDNNSTPLSPQEIFLTIRRTHRMNRVTLYRILDVLVAAGLVERISAGDRSFRYALTNQGEHSKHPHFFCSRCGNLECLNPKAFSLDIGSFQKHFTARIERVDVRLDGICKNCLRNQPAL